MQKRNIKILLSIITLILVSTVFLYNSINKKGTFSTTNYYLDTVNQVSLINVRKNKAERILPKIDKIILSINNEMSSHLPGSEVTKINNFSGIKPVKVSKDTFEVVKKSIYYSNKTSGKFDITIGSLTSLWNIGNQDAKVPSENEVSSLLPLIGYKNIELNEKDSTVFLKKKGMKIDLGGIAKGYCADKVADFLKKEKVENAIVNLGGNIFVFGKNKEGNKFSVGIQNPEKKNQDSMAKIKVTDKSIVTSGIYERYIEKGGKIYHHMLNPSTGFPFENNLSSVTIVSKKSIDGDALSTSTFGLGLENGMKLIESLKDVDAIFITKDDHVYITNGLKGNFEITNSRYTLSSK